MTRIVLSCLLFVTACGVAPVVADPIGTTGPITAPYTPSAGAWSGTADLLSFTVDRPDGGNLGCIPVDSRLIMPDFIFPLSGACTTTSTIQSEYQITCQYLGSGGHFTAEPNPREERVFNLSFQPGEQKINTCYYSVATGTMDDTDNWRDCRTHHWGVKFRQLIRCD